MTLVSPLGGYWNEHDTGTSGVLVDISGSTNCIEPVSISVGLLSLTLTVPPSKTITNDY